MPSYWFDSRRHYFVKNHGSAYAAAALVARLAGGAIHHLRCAISGEKQPGSCLFSGVIWRGMALACRLTGNPQHPDAPQRRTDHDRSFYSRRF